MRPLRRRDDELPIEQAERLVKGLFVLAAIGAYTWTVMWMSEAIWRFMILH